MARGYDTFDKLDLNGLQRELGELAEFMGRARMDHRALARGSKIAALLSEVVNDKVRGDTDDLEQVINSQRASLRSAFALLATAATGEQLRSSQLSRETSQRIQGIVTVITAALIAPALVVSVYGANLRELASGAKGNFWSLLALMACSAVVTTCGFRFLARKPLTSRRWFVPILVSSGAIILAAAWARFATIIGTTVAAPIIVTAMVVLGTALGTRPRADRSSSVGV